jgi:hypothetical protein
MSSLRSPLPRWLIIPPELIYKPLPGHLSTGKPVSLSRTTNPSPGRLYS